MISVILPFLNGAGALCLFLYGMKIMSDGIQKSVGNRLEYFFNSFVNNRLFGAFIGFVVTAIIQSSSAVTVMIVSFANAGIIQLTQAISLIIGSNIGTTATAWIVSTFGFKFDIAVFSLPMVAIGFPLFFSRKDNLRGFGEVIVGFALLFMGLEMLKDSIPAVTPEMVEKMAAFSHMNLGTLLLFTAIGLIVTAIVQSSSATTAIVLTLVAKNVIPFEIGAIMTLGANIGTTITAWLASLGTSVNAKRVAWSHILFNTIGATIWIILFHPAMIAFNVLTNAIHMSDPALRLALFHTIFNVVCAAIFLPVLNQFAWLVEKIVPDKPGQADPYHYNFEYTQATVLATPEIILTLAKREITHFADIVEQMANKYMELFNSPGEDKRALVENIIKQETMTDVMEEKITHFLVECSQAPITNEVRHNINAMIRIVKELESTADTVLNMTMVCKHRYNDKITMRPEAMHDLNDYFALAMQFLSFIRVRLNHHLSRVDLKEAQQLEKRINEERNRLKKNSEVILGQQGADIKSEILFLDTVRHTERIGDYFMNIAQSLRELRNA